MSAGSTGPLSERDVHTVANAVSRGEQPRVAALDAPDVPVGAKGTVVGYDPDIPEPFTVRLDIDGEQRDLRLPATALALVPRTRAEVVARTAGSAATPSDDDASGDGNASGNGGAARNDSAVRDDSAAGNDSAADGQAETRGSSTRKAKTARPARKAGRTGGDVVITVTVAGDGATVDATHGTRKLAKGATLPVSSGHALAQAIDLAPVTEAVESVIAEHRAAKQAEADQLRDRLAALERELAQYQDTDPDAATAASA